MLAFSRRALVHLDPYLLGGTLLLALIGVVGVHSVSGLDGGYFLRQLLWVGIGVTAFILLACLDYHVFSDHARVLYGISLVLLVAILIFGTEVNGNKSWILVGGMAFQPSELVKLVLIMVLTHFLAESGEDFLHHRQLFLLGGLTLLPVGLIMLQGDLGTAIVYVPIFFGVLLVAGLRLRWVCVLLMAALLAAPLGWAGLKEYQKQRILVTLDPDLDPQGIGYQTRQSQIAIGSGGLLGKGLGNGMQGQLGFVPEVHTDFMFALLAEEKGFIGGCLILLLYLLVIMRLIRIAETARDRTGILIITGIISMLFFHVVLNVGMTLGLLPAVGIPLPLLSYGGSSTLTVFAAMGLAQSVHCRRFIY